MKKFDVDELLNFVKKEIQRNEIEFQKVNNGDEYNRFDRGLYMGYKQAYSLIMKLIEDEVYMRDID